MFQMQIYIIVVLLLLSSGAVNGGLEKVLRLSQFIADIYQQFPHSCIFIINCEAQQQGEDWFYIIYNNCVFVVNRNVLTENWNGKCLFFPIYKKDVYFEIYRFSECLFGAVHFVTHKPHGTQYTPQLETIFTTTVLYI